jgi:GalNAc-alpha-(1->4)-GalNAc-alpha-(1->3)-diNAcBac-PP-undecaprenol alpha-1,4-N-acetyl-D-galactosaminyltransferase
MRIYLVIQSMSGGGAQRVLSILANYWSELGHEIILATFRTEDSFYTLDKRVKHIKLGLDSSSLKKKKVYFDNYFRVKSLAKSIKEQKADIVVSFMTNANILATLASRVIGTPIVVSERINYDFLSSKIWKGLRRAVYPFSDALVVQSSYDKDRYSFHKNCHVIYNPISVSHKYQNLKREKTILAVGRLEYQKGFDMLIDAFARVDFKDWELIILGEGSYRKELEDKISQNGLDKSVKLLGEVKDVEYFYKRASIFVLSSRMEGFPNVLVEAMVYGCTPIAFDCLTGPSDIIRDNENGILVEAESISKLSSAISYLLNNPDRVIEYSNRAKDIEKELDIKKISDKWMSIISSLLDDRGV